MKLENDSRRLASEMLNFRVKHGWVGLARLLKNVVGEQIVFRPLIDMDNALRKIAAKRQGRTDEEYELICVHRSDIPVSDLEPPASHFS